MSNLKDKQIAALKAELDRMKAGGKMFDKGGKSPPILDFPGGGLKAMGKKAGGMMKKKGMAKGGMAKKGMAAGGMMKKKGMAAGGLTAAIKRVDKKKKGMAAGGMMKKKGMAKGGMTKKGYKNGGKVRGVGVASKGFRPAKMVMMSKGGKKGGKK